MKVQYQNGAEYARALQKSGKYLRGVYAAEALGLLDRAIQQLREIYTQVEDMDSSSLPQELEWLADNRYILRREAAVIAEALASAPKKAGKEPFVLALARGFIEYAYGKNMAPDTETVLTFLQEAAAVEALSEGELASVPVMLRLSAILFIAEEAQALEESVAQAETLRRRGNPALADKLGFAISALRFLGTAQLEEQLYRVSTLEAILSRDPVNAYRNMEKKTKEAYRWELARLAKKAGISEKRGAEQVLELAQSGGSPRERHVGYYIYEKPLGKTKGHPGRIVYGLLLALLPAAFALLCGYLARSAWAGVLAYAPVFALLQQLIDRSALYVTRHNPLPRMSAEEKPTARTLCVISALLTRPEDAREYIRKLEEYRLAAGNIADCMSFGLLMDLPESREKESAGDKAVYSAAAEGIRSLNTAWGGGFLLFQRERVYYERDKIYRGRERKRGALEDLVRLIRGKESGLFLSTGEDSLDYQYIITLDSDTEPGIAALRELVAAMEHPLNRPVLDSTRRVVKQGHGIIHPRIAVDLETVGKNRFAAVYAGPGGGDPYGGSVPDLYNDLYGVSSFTGKGILDVAAYDLVLENRFPESRVLSHDMLEGSYLRAGYAGDVEFLDGFPGSVRSYYQREHRWIRGDWQLLPWLFSYVKTPAGRERNPLDSLAKWRILENMRRSLTPALTLAALLFALWLPHGLPLLSAALLNVAAPMLLCGLAAESGRERYHSNVLTTIKAALYRTVFDFATLPYRAWVGVSAAATALWRMTVTRQGLLDWTTAAQTEGDAESLSAYFNRMWLCCIAAAFALGAPYEGLAKLLLGAVIAALWAGAPCAARNFGKGRREKASALSPEDREYLYTQAGEMYGYFRDHLNAENCWLPPDNVQIQPALGVARRTSPTNIGLALLSVLAAAELGIEDTAGAIARLERTVATLERMEKWQGNLYNWYTTKDALPMYPRYVSTVDSGNLAACLIALSQGVSRWRESGAQALAVRIRKLASAMALAPLYDPDRKLFHLGWDAEHNRPGAGYYDLLASEARLASYVAIARGEVPVEHWGRLGRTLVGAKGYRGLGSWSGTMFEYLMPPLLLRSYPDSILYESEWFALYAQRAARLDSMPYGVSESGFFAFDTDMNYQYKAHGVQTLGFKRGLYKERVLAPYAAYLALPLDPIGAVENLRRYEALDMRGAYGYYEALDLTRPRIPEGCAYMPVRSYMAHHLGMSLLAVANVLKDQVLVNHFMGNSFMGAFRSLLKERIPVSAGISHENEQEAPPLPRRVPNQETVIYEGEDYDPWSPECIMLANGSYRTFVTETGLNRTLCGMRDLYRFDGHQVEGVPGMLFFLKTGGRLLSMTPAPFFHRDVRYKTRFEAARAVIGMEYGSLRGSVTAMVCPDDTAGVRQVYLKNTGETTLETTLVFYMEPTLEMAQAFSAHPAFSKLFLRVEPQPDGAAISRLGNDGGESYAYLATDGAIENVGNSREQALGRRGYLGLLTPAKSGQSGAPDPCCAIHIPVALAPGGEQIIRFALAYGRSADMAREAARRALGLNRTVAAHRMTEVMAALGLSERGVQSAFGMYRDASFVTPQRRKLRDAIEGNTRSRETLWKFGVSGDLPIITLRPGETVGEREEQLLRQHMLLYVSGAYADFVLLLNDGGEYLQPSRTELMDILREWGGESIVGTKGGVFLVDESALEAGELDALIAFSGVYYDFTQEQPDKKAEQRPLRVLANMEELADVTPQPEIAIGNAAASFRGMPALAWSHPLANRSFGYLASDAGTGYMWYHNARENKLNQWVNDPIGITGPESLELLIGGKAHSLFARDGDSRVRYSPGAAVWEREIGSIRTRLTAFVHPKIAARVFLIELRGEAALSAKLRWFTRLQLGERTDGQVQTVFSAEKRVIYAKNAANHRFAPYVFAFTANPAPESFTCDEADYRSGEMHSRTGAGLLPCIAAQIPLEREGELYRAVIVCGCTPGESSLELLTQFSDFTRAQKALAETLEYWETLAGGVEVKTPEPRLDQYVNGFNLYQVIAGRIFARTSMYQSSGAYGFRDQLQDALSLLSAPPSRERYQLVRVQLLRAATHQYQEGDVQHWWHPDRLSSRRVSHRGVRTRMTDDLLFLPYVALQYLRVTGDRAFFNLEIPYIREEPLAPGEGERFGTPEKALSLRESLWMHCARAADCFLGRGVGVHGLALMGGGDWNDAMNKVGAAGRGESVWLSWFGAMVLAPMAEEARVRGDAARADAWSRFSDALIQAAYQAWDGQWFLRGWYDSGAPLGAAASDACRIDAISQAFAVLADPNPKEKSRRELQKTALKSAVQMLWNGGAVVQLFTPPFTRESKDAPGYIKAYPPGVRENGGQYTHGAVWLAMGLMGAGMTQEAAAMLMALLPGGRGQRYLTEPFYLAADVYAAEGLYGRGGWSIYTGAAGWYYQAAVGMFLGLQFVRGKLYITPRLPIGWQRYEAVICLEGGKVELTVRRGKTPGLTVNGAPSDGITLPQGGETCKAVYTFI